MVADGFDPPVGTADERASDAVWPGTWFDATGFGTYYTAVGPAYHTGADLNNNGPRWDADAHAPVYAPADGLVTFSAPVSGSWGYIIVIRHDPLADGTRVWSRFGHVENPLVRAGDRVERGQQICNIGNASGKAPYHLHFDIAKTNILEQRPTHWPGLNRAAVYEHYVDPRTFILAHRPERPAAPRPPVLATQLEATARLNLRHGPSTATPVRRVLADGEHVVGIERAGVWWRVRDGTGAEGWAHGGWLRPVGGPLLVPASGRAWLGLHGPPEQWREAWTDSVLRVYAQGRFEAAVVLVPGTGAAEVTRLRQAGVQFVCGRLDWFGRPDATPAEFAEHVAPDLRELAGAGVFDYQVKNEVNLLSEFAPGLDRYVAWHLDVLRRLRAIAPAARFGFPAPSPGGQPGVAETLARCRRAVEASDWLAFHIYPADPDQARAQVAEVVALARRYGRLAHITELSRGVEREPAADVYLATWQEAGRQGVLSVHVYLVTAGGTWHREALDVRPAIVDALRERSAGG